MNIVDLFYRWALGAGRDYRAGSEMLARRCQLDVATQSNTASLKKAA